MADILLITEAAFIAADNSGSQGDLITNASGSLTVSGSFICSTVAGAPTLYYSFDGGISRIALNTTSISWSGSSGSFSFSANFSVGSGSISFWTEPDSDNSVGVFTYTISGSSIAPTTINSISDNVAGGMVGSLSSGSWSNDATLLLHGNAAAGSTVVVRNGTTVIGTVTANPNGAWSLTTAELANGTYSFVATATDAAGTSNSSAAFAVTVDRSAPLAPTALNLRSGSDPSSAAVSGGSTSLTSLYLHGSAEAGSTVTVFNGGTILGTTSADATTGAWVFALPGLEDGNTYSFRASATDAAGNSSSIAAPVLITVIASPSEAPQITSVSDNVSDGAVADTGSISNGGFSNDTTLSLAGTAAAGLTVRIYDGDTLLDTTRSDSGGLWSYTTSALSEGSHSFSSTTVNGTGLESAPSNPWLVSIDTTDPGQPAAISVSDDAGPVQGNLSSGASTDDTSLTLSGTVEAGALVSIFDTVGSSPTPTLLATVQADSASGAWIYSAAGLSAGAHSFRVQTSDAAGNESALSDAFAVTVDSSTPATPLISGALNADTSASLSNGALSPAQAVTLSGSVTSGLRVFLYNGADRLGEATVNDSSWAFTASDLQDGSVYHWSARAENAAGSLSDASSAFTLTVDRSAPLISTTTSLLLSGGVPALKENSGANQLIYTASAADLSAVSWSLDGPDAAAFAINQATGALTLIGNPDYEVRATSNYSYSVTLVATDAAGNSSSKALSLKIQNVDEVAPVFSSPATSLSTIVEGSGANQLIYDASASDSDGNGLFSFSLAGTDATAFRIEPDTGKVYLIADPDFASQSSYSFSVVATDSAGNSSSQVLNLTVIDVDNEAPNTPVILGLFAADGTTAIGTTINGAEAAGTIVLKGTAEAGSTVQVSWDGVSAAPALADASGVWSVSFSSSQIPADAPTTQISVTATDAAGNTSAAALLSPIVIDRVVAQPTLATVANDNTINASEAAALVLGGTTEPGSVLTLVWNGVTYNTGIGANEIQVDAAGLWSLAVPAANVPSGTGTSILTLSALDAAGNSSTALIQSIAHDTVAPTVSVSDNLAGTANNATGAIAYTVQFSEAVSTLETSDFSISNGTISGISGSGSTYTVTVTPAAGVAGGSIDVSLKADAIQDAAGNGNATVTNSSQAIDTLAPTGLSLNSVAGDDVVNASEKAAGFSIGGAVEAGSTVTVLWGNQTRTAIVTGSTWTLAYASNQIPADGAALITVTARDAAGNASSLSRTITVDTVAPTATVSSLSLSNDSSSSIGVTNTDFVTNVASQTISGTLSAAVAPSDVVEISLDGGSNWLTASTPSSTSFSLSGASLLSGTNTLQVRVRDAAGNSGALRRQSYTLDQSATYPATGITASTGGVTAAGLTLSADTGSSSSDRLTNTALQTFSGNLINAMLAGERVQFSLDGLSWGPATTSTNKSSFSFSASLSEGANTVQVRHIDAAGNISAPYSASVTLDRTAAAVQPVLIPDASTGSYKLGDVITVTVPFSETVLVSGTPQLGLLVGSNTRLASYVGSSGGNTLLFSYSVVAGDGDLDGISISAGALNLNRGTITDAAGNAASIANLAVAANINAKVDSAVPSLLSAEVVNGDVVLTFSEALSSGPVSTGYFTLTNGLTVSSASANGTKVTLITSAPVPSSGVAVTYNDNFLSGDLTSGVIQDAAGNDAAAFSGRNATRLITAGSMNLPATTTFTTVENISTSNDSLTGNASANSLIGNEGNNTISGGGGADTLTGRGGGDRFAYATNADSLLSGFDVITDFVVGTDQIDGARASTTAIGASKGTATALTANAISAVLTNASFSATTAAAWFTLGSGSTTRTFLALNNTTAGFQANGDAIIEISGYSGTLSTLAVI